MAVNAPMYEATRHYRLRADALRSDPDLTPFNIPLSRTALLALLDSAKKAEFNDPAPAELDNGSADGSAEPK